MYTFVKGFLFSSNPTIPTPVIDCNIECQFKEALGTLCGFDEYTDVSTPPKLYRTQTIAGNWCDNDHFPPDCNAAIANADRSVYEGSYVYDQFTCAETNNQLIQYYQGTTGADCSAVSSVHTTTTAAKNFAPSIGVISLSSATHKTWDPRVTCASLGGGSAFRHLKGEITADLSDEDTEADALFRAEQEIDWTDCGNCLSCTAYISARGDTDFSVSGRMVQTRAIVYDLPEIGHDYQVSIGIFERALGSSDTWTLAYTLQQTITPLTSSEALSSYTDWIDIPRTSGIERQAQTCSVEEVFNEE